MGDPLVHRGTGAGGHPLTMRDTAHPLKTVLKPMLRRRGGPKPSALVHKPPEPPLARHHTKDFLPVETARACSTMRRAGTVCNAIRGGLTMPRVQNQLLGVWLRVCLWLVMHISRTCFHCTKLYYVTTAAPQRAYSARSRGVPARLGRFKHVKCLRARVTFRKRESPSLLESVHYHGQRKDRTD